MKNLGAFELGGTSTGGCEGYVILPVAPSHANTARLTESNLSNKSFFGCLGAALAETSNDTLDAADGQSEPHATHLGSFVANLERQMFSSMFSNWLSKLKTNLSKSKYSRSLIAMSYLLLHFEEMHRQPAIEEPDRTRNDSKARNQKFMSSTKVPQSRWCSVDRLIQA